MRKTLTEKQAAEYLGLSLSVLRRGRKANPEPHLCIPPPHIKAGKVVRYLIEDLDAWLMQHRTEPNKHKV